MTRILFSACRALPAELEGELFSRVASFFGEEEYEQLRSSFVIVVGLGGVGSHAAHMLVRPPFGPCRQGCQTSRALEDPSRSGDDGRYGNVEDNGGDLVLDCRLAQACDESGSSTLTRWVA